MGDKPTGYATSLPEGRVYFVLTGEGRKAAKTDVERAELLGFAALKACLRRGRSSASFTCASTSERSTSITANILATDVAVIGQLLRV